MKKFGLTDDYLREKDWYNATAYYDNDKQRYYPEGDVAFDDVSKPQKGTTIYVYGDLDKIPCRK